MRIGPSAAHKPTSSAAIRQDNFVRSRSIAILAAADFSICLSDGPSPQLAARLARRDKLRELIMRRFVIFALTIALLAGLVDLADAKSSHKKGKRASQSGFVQRDVGLRVPYGPPANANLKYGPQPYYPQSPPGGGP
jgi:hypothetical protein